MEHCNQELVSIAKKLRRNIMEMAYKAGGPTHVGFALWEVIK